LNLIKDNYYLVLIFEPHQRLYNIGFIFLTLKKEHIDTYFNSLVISVVRS